MSAKRLVAIALVGSNVVACSANSGPKATADHPSGNGPARAAADPFLGNRIGAALDDEDRRRATAAQMQALETGPSGAPVAWRNPDSGRYGNIVPGPVYQANGTTCRQFTHTIFSDGTPQTERAAACRNPDGTWIAVN